METKNLSKGLHQVFVSRLMTLIGTILVAIGSVLSIFLLAMAFGGEAGGLAGTGVAGAVLLIVGLVLLVIGLIFSLIGYGNAAKDDARFKTVLLLALISLACSIISGFVGSIAVLPQILKIASTVLDLLVIVFTLMYTCDDLAQKGRTDLAEKGNNILKLILVIVLLNLIVEVIGIIAVALASILSIVTLVLQIVYWFSFMIFLSKASKAFA